MHKLHYVLTYIDDCVNTGPAMEEIDEFIESLKNGPENLLLTDEGDIDKFLRIEITQLNNRQFKLSQMFLNDRIVSFLRINKNKMDTNTKSTPVSKPLLHKHVEGKPHEETWNDVNAITPNSKVSTTIKCHRTRKL